MDIYEMFHRLDAARSRIELSAIPLPGARRDFLAKSEDGAPVFLLSDSSPPDYFPPIELQNVRVDFHQPCSVDTCGSQSEGQFATVSCDARVPELHEIFIHSVAASLQKLPVSANTLDLQACIQSLLRLFQALSKPSGRHVAGLWGELFVIKSVRRKDLLLSAWHSKINERFDFSWSNGSLEVKATTTGWRRHEFSQQQLCPSVIGRGWVVSLMLQRQNGGLGVVDLAREIEADIYRFPELREKLWECVLSSVGSEFSESLDVRFDVGYAERNMMIIPMAEVPRITDLQDPRISGIKYQADLSSSIASRGDLARSELDHMFS